jgi:hypothetical protein
MYYSLTPINLVLAKLRHRKYYYMVIDLTTYAAATTAMEA